MIDCDGDDGDGDGDGDAGLGTRTGGLPHTHSACEGAPLIRSRGSRPCLSWRALASVSVLGSSAMFRQFVAAVLAVWLRSGRAATATLSNTALPRDQNGDLLLTGEASVMTHNGSYYFNNVVLFEENSIILLPECSESSGW